LVRSRGPRVFKTVEEARSAYKRRILTQVYEDAFYTARVKCPNCRVQGTFHLVKGVAAEGSECPRCGVTGLAVLGMGTKKVTFTPSLSDEVLSKIDERIEEMIEEGLSHGEIFRQGGLFA